MATQLSNPHPAGPGPAQDGLARLADLIRGHAPYGR